MNTEDLLYHLEVIEAFEPFNEILFINGILKYFFTALCILGIIFLSIKTGEKYTDGLKNSMASLAFVSGTLILVAQVKINNFEDYNQSWSQVEGYESITLVSDLLNGSNTDKKITIEYVERLISDGEELIKESERLKLKLSLIEMDVKPVELVKGNNQ